jgi:hypothetical protein
MSDVGARLREAFGEARLRRDAALAPLTTFKVGGPADWLLDAHGSEDLRLAVGIARAAAIPVTILGGGSNVLVADGGSADWSSACMAERSPLRVRRLCGRTRASRSTGSCAGRSTTAWQGWKRGQARQERLAGRCSAMRTSRAVSSASSSNG